MKKSIWALGLSVCLGLLMGLPATCLAFTPGNFIVSPQSIDLGTIRVLPGQSAGPFQFSVSIVGGPTPGADESATYNASSDAAWVSLSPSNGAVPGNMVVQLTISGTMDEAVWTSNVVISSGLDPSTPQVTIPVRANVVRSIGDVLTVSPGAIDLRITQDEVSQQSVPITIANADPDKTGFEWSAVANRSWINLSAGNGQGNSTITLSIDENALSLTADTDTDGTFDNATGTVTIRSNLHTDAVTLSVGITIVEAADATPSSLTVSPQSIDVGTVRVLPGESAGPFSFNIAVAGGPTAPVGSSATYIASTDASWLSLSPTSGGLPGTISAQASIPENMGQGLWTATVTIISGLDPSLTPATVTVTMNVIRSIGDLLTVSPSDLKLRVTEASVSQQSIPIAIANADPDRTNYTWSAVTDVPWLNLSALTGQGNTTISLSINQALLVLTTDTDGDGEADRATGTITVRSNLHSDAATLTVELTMTISDENQVKFSVSPSQLYWSVEKSDTTSTLTFTPQSLYVWAQAGWTAAFDVPYLKAAAYDKNGGVLGGLISKDTYGRLEITPVEGVIQTMDYGTYTTYVTITDYYNQNQRQIPVTVNIRQPGQQFVLPTTYEISPHYSMVEAADASLIDLKIPLVTNYAYYPDQTSCLSAGGTWIDPDNTSGNLNEYCSRNQKIYMLIERPEMDPGNVYIMKRSGQLGLAYYNGILVPGADAYSYADGPVPEIPLGPMQLLGCYGKFTVSIKSGSNLSSAAEVHRVQINLKTPDGLWKVTETYQGETYSYDDMLLSLSRVPNQYGYTGTWGGNTVTLSAGDGTTVLYQLYFTQNGLDYVYEVQQLSDSVMTGRWQFTWPGGASTWETFRAQRMLWAP